MPNIDYKGAGRKVGIASTPKPGALANAHPTRKVPPTGLGQVAHSPGQPSKVAGNVHVPAAGECPPGVQDAQTAHDIADMNKARGDHPRGPEWMRRRKAEYERQQMDAMMRRMGY